MAASTQPDRRPVWGKTPAGSSSYAHSFLPIPVVALQEQNQLHIQLCTPQISMEGAPQAVPDDMPRCPDCQHDTARLDGFSPRPDSGEPEPPPYNPHGHPSLVAQVNAEFEAAGGRWAALQQRPLDPRRVRREMESILREHHGNFPAMLREVLGYLDLAMAAAYKECQQDFP